MSIIFSSIKILNPDNGGNDSDFILMKNEYDDLKRSIADTVIISKETNEIEELIKCQNHPNYPNYSQVGILSFGTTIPIFIIFMRTLMGYMTMRKLKILPT